MVTVAKYLYMYVYPRGNNGMAYEVPSTRNSNEVTYEVPNMQKEVFAACTDTGRTD
jgi:hypothetical protein